MGEEQRFFKARQLLFVDLPDLVRVERYLKERTAYEKRVFFNIPPESELPPPPKPLDFDALRKKYQAQGIRMVPDGYFATADQQVRLLITYMPGKGLRRAQKMKTAVEHAVASLPPAGFAPDLQVRYTGNVENLLEESAALVADLEFSTAVVLLLEILVLLIFFRSWLGTLALLASLLAGVFWTFGLSYFLISFLNANSAFLASIIIGNGINFGIILLARYLEERRRGSNNEEAIEQAMRMTAPATLIAVLNHCYL